MQFQDPIMCTILCFNLLTLAVHSRVTWSLFVSIFFRLSWLGELGLLRENAVAPNLWSPNLPLTLEVIDFPLVSRGFEG